MPSLKSLRMRINSVKSTRKITQAMKMVAAAKLRRAQSQAEAARRLGITQPRLNDLLRGRITNFSLDTLINLATQAGLTVRLDIADAA